MKGWLLLLGGIGLIWAAAAIWQTLPTTGEPILDLWDEIAAGEAD